MTPKVLSAAMRYLSVDCRGAAKGGRARAASLTPAERTASARRAANARWARVREAQREEFSEAQRAADELVSNS